MVFLLSWLVLSSVFVLEISAATVTYNWDIGFVQANPDGRAPRPVLGINGKFPNPTIAGNVGDKIVVNVNNKTPNETTSIHFHGLYQLNNNAQDGPPGMKSMTTCTSRNKLKIDVRYNSVRNSPRTELYLSIHRKSPSVSYPSI
jgi:hypothetical protein